MQQQVKFDKWISQWDRLTEQQSEVVHSIRVSSAIDASPDLSNKKNEDCYVQNSREHVN